MAKQPIGLLAVGSESRPLLAKMQVETKTRHGMATFYQGSYQGKDAVLVRMAMGKVNAAMAAQSLIDLFDAAPLILSGSAGAVAPEVEVGDVVIGAKLVSHDAGIYLSEGFRFCGVMASDGQGRQGWVRAFQADPLVVQAALRAGDDLLWPRGAGKRTPAVRVGAIVSGDQVIFSQEKKKWLHRTFGALAVEMEGAAVAQVAAANGRPWLVVRAISDQADASTGFDFTPLLDYLDEPRSRWGRIRGWGRKLWYLLSNLSIVPRRMRLRRNVHLAAENAARLVEAMMAELNEQSISDSTP
ncbi:MAG TPA: 5'-methylthioadenosine/adenosylhomocysteine nucleosidase [Anaerolineae bacterium]|nr:5'-methylthioadenosine/adenosylhomocysteine nucleosidase [Anaerolineae bacterium]